MTQQPVPFDPSARRAHARRTALIVGLVALAIYLLAIGEVVLGK